MADRLLSLDVIRGIAVMGIFSVNVVGMAMIENAYFYPLDYGFEGLGDKIMWAANFVLVDGKFRSMFSILFGASMVLVLERAVAAGREPGSVHFPRMAVLLLFGLAHFYLLWWGDILANYALVGMLAFVFWRMDAALLTLIAAVVLASYYAPDIASASPSAQLTAQEVALERQRYFTSPEAVVQAKEAHQSIAAHARATLSDPSARVRPFASALSYGIETLGLMLIGMAAYKSGFLTGRWQRRTYAAIAAVLISASLALFGFAAWKIVQSGYDPLVFKTWGQSYVEPMHAFAALGYMALIMLLFRRGAVANAFAAVGRMAFSNYLGSTVIGVLLFFGTFGGLYGELSRGQAWLIVPPVWLLMLLWSNWWLARFRYGPLEWAWRSLARMEWQPMRKAA